MSVHFKHTSIEDYKSSNGWNPTRLVLSSNGIQVDSSKIDSNNSSHYITQFSGTPDPQYDLQWSVNPTHSPLSILLVHYNPLKNIRHLLNLSDKEMREFLESHNGLPIQYQQQVISFQNELKMLGKKFNLDAERMAINADVIICCWGEFMESPYKEKHVFQGESRAAVFLHSYNDRTEVQGQSSWA